MAKNKLAFVFPTDDKQALALFHLQADLSDLADGDDDVDESVHLTKAWLKEQLATGRTPTVQELADGAAGRDALMDYAALAADAPAPDVDADGDAKIGWQDIATAFATLEEQGSELDAANISSALAGLGFERCPALEAASGCLVFERPKRFVGVRLYQLGNIRVAEIAVAKTKKKHKADDGDFGGLKRGSSGAYVAGTLIGASFWSELVHSFVKTLSVARSALESAGEGDAVPQIPVEFSAFKALVAAGKDEGKRLEDDQELAEIGALQAKIRQAWLGMLGDGTAPSAVVLQFDGPDGAGKTSSSKYIPSALLSANDDLPEAERWTVRTEIFKAPTQQDKDWMAQDAGASLGLPKWLARHVKRGSPAKREILIKDRFQAGDYVYVGEQTPERLAEMTGQNAKYEEHLAAQGALVFSALLYADSEKQAKTFGKRMARGALVDALIGELQARDELSEERKTKLEEVKAKVQRTDLVGLSRFEQVLPHYRAFSASHGCPIIDATDRHAARLDLLKRFYDALVAYGKGK